jgi:hypothetical protein
MNRVIHIQISVLGLMSPATHESWQLISSFPVNQFERSESNKGVPRRMMSDIGALIPKRLISSRARIPEEIATGQQEET